ncbi:MAG: type II toxin-antitoxin system RelE/ParE family toxin [Gammaproteobacteria bacterium]|nr:type II toxin-antitoxin system RelE/ParE family toxin [Gammaproteobacteria bacterium]
MKYGFHPAAEVEYLEQIAWFEQQQAGLGRRFVTAVESAITRACRSPTQYRVEHAPDMRRTVVRGFPFAILFRELDGTIEILAISHYRRRPRYWLPRLT